MAVVGLAGQLFTASLEGYNLLSTAQSFGRDYDDLCFRLDTEKLCLEKWAEAWVLDQSSRQINPSDRDYRFAVATLARISAVFAELLEYSSYGMHCDRGPRKRDVIQQRLRSLFRSAEEPSVNPPGLDQDSINLLNNPSLLNFDQIRPGLEEEVKRLSYSAESLQKALPVGRKLRWSMFDKDKFENLIARLKEHNMNLNRILPVSPNSSHPRGWLYVISLEILSGEAKGLTLYLKRGFDLPHLPSQ